MELLVATRGNWHLSVADPPRPLDSDNYALLPSPMQDNWVGGDAGNTLVLSGALSGVHTPGVSHMQTTSRTTTTTTTTTETEGKQIARTKRTVRNLLI